MARSHTTQMMLQLLVTDPTGKYWALHQKEHVSPLQRRCGTSSSSTIWAKCLFSSAPSSVFNWMLIFAGWHASYSLPAAVPRLRLLRRSSHIKSRCKIGENFRRYQECRNLGIKKDSGIRCFPKRHYLSIKIRYWIVLIKALDTNHGIINGI